MQFLDDKRGNIQDCKYAVNERTASVGDDVEVILILTGVAVKAEEKVVGDT